MNISHIFILRPIATSLLTLALFLVGLLAYRFLPLSALPEVDYPTIQVQAFYPGASPQVMAAMVTAPLERQFGSMPGLSQMSSISTLAASTITLQFGLNISLDIAEQEVQAAINAASALLPRDLVNPPSYKKVNPADPAILTIAATSDAIPLTELEDLVDTRLAQKISQISGVGLVSLSGGQKPAVRIQIDPQNLAAMNLNLANVRSSVIAANINDPKGSFDGKERTSTINANDQLTSAEEYAKTIIAYQNGAAVRLQDVATVYQGAENAKLSAWVNLPLKNLNKNSQEQNLQDHNSNDHLNKIDTEPKYATFPAIILSIQRQPNANVLKVAKDVKELLKRLEPILPGNIQLTIITDRTITIQATISDVQFELALAVFLVIAVIWLFLRNVRATLIPALAVPLSLIGALIGMYIAGYSINNLTLMAMVIAAGFVVDDAIVVIENISRYLEQGFSPQEAALKGAGQIGFTIISLTISLVAVLIPLLFMADVSGRLFREFAATLAMAILFSAVISLTLTPMLCATILKERKINTNLDQKNNQQHKDYFQIILDYYAKSLDWVFLHKLFILLIAIATLILTFILYIIVPKGFFPVQDVGVIQGILEARADSSSEAMANYQEEAAKLILADPAVESVTSIIGVDGINNHPGTARLIINLKPLKERKDRAYLIAERLQAPVGTRLFLRPVQDLTIEDRLAKMQYLLSIEGINTEELQKHLPDFVTTLAKSQHISGVALEHLEKGRALFLNINRDLAARYNISMSEINNTLYDALGQRQISTIFTQTNQYKVVLEVAEEFRKDPQDLDKFYVRGQNGLIPLSNILTIEEKSTPIVLARQEQFPMAQLSFNVSNDSFLGYAIADVQYALENLPKTLSPRFQGASYAFLTANTNQIYLILAAIITMYIVLGVLYESYIHPITILSTLPSATVGALLALLLFKMDLGVVGIIGIILLIGIVKKNAIMMIDFALEAERVQNLMPQDAIRQACLLRLRPILMTTFAALLSAVPLALGLGMGAELRQPLGITLIGGLILSQILTLFTTPVIYLYFDQFARYLIAFKRSFSK